MLFMGTNDIRRGATATSVIEAQSLIKQVKAKGFRVIGATIIPNKTK